MMEKRKFIVGIALIVIAIALGAWQWTVMQANVERVELASQTAAELTKTNKSLTAEYQDVKAEVVRTREQAEQALSLVYPTDENITDFTRMIDNFAAKNNFSSNPFFVNNLSYQNAKEGYVPVQMSVKTSKKNLEKFLDYVEQSGSLENEVRLMSIEEMNINTPDEYGGTYDVNFTIYAYYGSN